jgi:NADPH-dependent 2,4-dienoyl-CoA reductase/sulfur reductase-like enzyme
VVTLIEQNAKLREQGAQLFDKTLELGTENAKLRELCVKALEWLRWAGGITCPPEVPDEFADELRELGVEVDA